MATVAKRYARAMLDIGIEQGKLEQFREQIDGLAELYSGSRELRTVLLNPGVKLEERKGIIGELVKRASMEPIVGNFAMLLLDKDRFKFIEAIAREFGKLADAHGNIVRATTTSAEPLAAAQLEAIRSALEKHTGKTVLIESDVDAALIGGVVTRIGSTVYDGSVRTQLDQMRAAILEQA